MIQLQIYQKATEKNSKKSTITKILTTVQILKCFYKTCFYTPESRLTVWLVYDML